MATEPRSLGQYEKRYAHNTTIDGHGSATTTHFACPFCAARDWCAARILEVETVLRQEHTCKHCGRSAKCIIARDGGSMNMKLVQTGGDDPPEWLPPPEDQRSRE